MFDGNVAGWAFPAARSAWWAPAAIEIGRPRFAVAVLECYTVTMSNPLSPTASAGARLILAAALLAAVWLSVLWAMA